MPDDIASQRVNAIILGAQKCATTSLFFALGKSPDIEGSKVKETNFFSHTPDWRADMSDYHDLFRQRRPVLLEASPSYTMPPHSERDICGDMYDYNPDLRFIYITRHPIDRLTSAYRHTFERGATEQTFEDYLTTNERALDCTRYAKQIEPFIERFGRDRILLLRFEDVTNRQRDVARTVAQFLGVDAAFADRLGSVHVNDGRKQKYHMRFDKAGVPLRVLDKVAPPVAKWWKRRQSPKMRGELVAPPAARAQAIAKLLPDIEKFEQLSGWDLADWKR